MRTCNRGRMAARHHHQDHEPGTRLFRFGRAWAFKKTCIRERCRRPSSAAQFSCAAGPARPDGKLKRRVQRGCGGTAPRDKEIPKSESESRRQAGCCQQRPPSAAAAATTTAPRRSHQPSPSPSRKITAATPRRRRRPRVAPHTAQRAHHAARDSRARRFTAKRLTGELPHYGDTKRRDPNQPSIKTQLDRSALHPRQVWQQAS
jgi:hypothetical protein